MQIAQLLSRHSTTPEYSIESAVDLGSRIAALKRDLLDALDELRGELSQRESQGLSRVDSLVSNHLETEESIEITSISISVLRKLWFPGMDS